MEEMTSGMQETTEAIVKINRYVDNLVADTANENEQIADLLDKEVNRFIL